MSRAGDTTPGRAALGREKLYREAHRPPEPRRRRALLRVAREVKRVRDRPTLAVGSVVWWLNVIPFLAIVPPVTGGILGHPGVGWAAAAVVLALVVTYSVKHHRRSATSTSDR